MAAALGAGGDLERDEEKARFGCRFRTGRRQAHLPCDRLREAHDAPLGVARVGSRVQQEIADLAALGTDDLRERWTELYRVAPTPRISRDILIRGVAFRIQEEAHGGLGKSCRRQLKRLAETLREEG